jgi:hypothetical protein
MRPGIKVAPAEIDDLGIGAALDRGAYRDDAVPFDTHFARRLQAAGLDVEQVGGMQDDGMGGMRVAGLRHGRGRVSGEQQNERASQETPRNLTVHAPHSPATEHRAPG